MPTTLPTYTGESTSLVQPTGIPLVDAVMVGTKWGAGPAGTGATLTYSFPDGFDDFDTRSGIAGNYNALEPTQNGNSQFLPGFTPFGEAQQDAARAMFQTWASVANLYFNEVAPTGIDAGVLRFAFTAPPGFGATTYASSAFPQDLPLAGDTWFNSAFIFPDGWVPGTQNYLTLLHEVGHALGLKHPHDTGDTTLTAGWSVAPVVLPFTGSDTLNTYSTQDMVMAYNDKPGVGAPIQADFAPTTPMRVDIAAIQYLYGANTTYNAGNTTYTFRSDTRYNQTIWDAGGNDTFCVEGNARAVINLNPGTWSALGLPLTYSERDPTSLAVLMARPDLTDSRTIYIYDTVLIENAIGGGGNDVIVGNQAANQIIGSGGNDEMDGGAGGDTLAYLGRRSDYAVNFDAQTGRYTIASAADGFDQAINFEHFKFSNVELSAANLIDTVAPTPVSISPLDGAKGVPGASSIVATFNEAMEWGTGAVTLRTSAGATVATYTAGSDKIAVSGNTVTINPGRDLGIYGSYVVEFGAAALRDLAGNAFTAPSPLAFSTGTLDSLYHFFVVAFNAAPGVAYMGQLAEAYNYGLSVKQIVNIFTTKSQFTDVYAESLSNRDLATQLVNNIVKGSATEQNKAAAVSDVESALSIGWTRGDVIFAVFGNLATKPLDDSTWGNTALQFGNQTAVARHYTEVMQANTTDLNTLRAVIGSVSHTTDVSTPEIIATLIGTALGQLPLMP